MTAKQYRDEWQHVYETRLGILCGDRKPTDRQEHMARIEADEHIAKLKAKGRRQK